jgi:hypothetical protein
LQFFVTGPPQTADSELKLLVSAAKQPSAGVLILARNANLCFAAARFILMKPNSLWKIASPERLHSDGVHIRPGTVFRFRNAVQRRRDSQKFAKKT